MFQTRDVGGMYPGLWCVCEECTAQQCGKPVDFLKIRNNLDGGGSENVLVKSRKCGLLEHMIY